MNDTAHYVPQSMEDSPLTLDHAPADIEEYANGVVHPTTKETITKYDKLIAEDELRGV